MNVLKFGGTSVGTPASMTNLVEIVEKRQEPLIVIVSALGGVTDLLINCATLASQGSQDYIPHLRTIIERHREMINVMVKNNRPAVALQVNEMLSQLSDIFRGISLLREVSQRSMDIIVSFGERMSSLIVAGAISGARHIDSLEIVKTEKWYNKNIASSELTQQAFRNLNNMLAAGKPIIMGGFISRDKESGDITNLGRGGSDYTAALAAAALNADCLEIWTDVDGFMTADPRIIPAARVLDKMSFVDSIELCNFGAKVVYPPTIYPVFHKNIPIKVLNTFNPSAPGTLICEGEAIKYTEPTLAGVSALRTTSLVAISGVDHGIRAITMERAMSILSKKGIQIVLADSRIAPSQVTIIINRCDLDTTLKTLEEEFAPELSSDTIKITNAENISVIAIVGEKINQIRSLTESIFLIAARNSVSILAAPAAPTPTTFTIAVESSTADTMLRCIHKEFIEI